MFQTNVYIVNNSYYYIFLYLQFSLVGYEGTTLEEKEGKREFSGKLKLKIWPFIGKQIINIQYLLIKLISSILIY